MAVNILVYPLTLKYAIFIYIVRFYSCLRRTAPPLENPPTWTHPGSHGLVQTGAAWHVRGMPIPAVVVLIGAV